MTNLENLREYRFQNKFIKNFFLSNNILFMNCDNNFKTINHDILEKDSKNYHVYILNKHLTANYKINHIKEIVSNIISHYNKPDCLYLDKRINVKEEIILSKEMDIKIKQIDEKTKNILIVYNFYKIKELMSRKGIEYFKEIYRYSKGNECVETLVNKMRKGLIIFDFDEYCYILALKRLINIYYKEVDSSIDFKNPSFKDSMLLKYLDNYFSKYAIIDFYKEKVKNFISKYYITEYQSEDRCNSFIRNFMKFFETIYKLNLKFENHYRFDLRDLYILRTRKALNLNCKKFPDSFDKVMKDENNYYNFMFLLETLELTKSNSEKKSITDYITILELFLVKGDKNISKQIQDKCMKLLSNKDFTKEELKLIYNYRSKLIHGDYKESLKKLNELAQLSTYTLTKLDEFEALYLNREQLIEEKVKKRLFDIVYVVLKKFIMDNDSLIELKYSDN